MAGYPHLCSMRTWRSLQRLKPHDNAIDLVTGHSVVVISVETDEDGNVAKVFDRHGGETYEADIEQLVSIDSRIRLAAVSAGRR